MKKVLGIVAMFMLLSTTAFAANWGMVIVNASVPEVTAIWLDGDTAKTGAVTGNLINFGNCAAGANYAQNKTQINYDSNLVSVEVTVTNVSTDNASAASVFAIDGLVRWDDVVPGATAASVHQGDLYVHADANGTLSAADIVAWQQVYDSQRFPYYVGTTLHDADINSPGFAGDEHVLYTGTAEGQFYVYYKAQFAADPVGGSYGAAVQYSFRAE